MIVLCLSSSSLRGCVMRGAKVSAHGPLGLQVLVRGEPNISYICSRYYRAPELIFGATDYTTAIDLWSVGCVMAELLLGQPLFPGESGVDQLVEIIKVRQLTWRCCQAGHRMALPSTQEARNPVTTLTGDCSRSLPVGTCALGTGWCSGSWHPPLCKSA